MCQIYRNWHNYNAIIPFLKQIPLTNKQTFIPKPLGVKFKAKTIIKNIQSSLKNLVDDAQSK